MTKKKWTASLFALVMVSGFHFACSGDLDPASAQNSGTVEEDKKKHDMRHAGDMAHGPRPDLSGGNPDLSGGGGHPDMSHPGPMPEPPPSSCDQRHAGVTAIQVLVTIDEYQGVIHGRNGDHEIAYGTVTDTVWVYDTSIVDTSNVQLALNVHSAIDPSGLPNEIPLSPGDVVQAEGEYIPASTANAHDKKGAAAVIHYTHSPCGFIDIGGTRYK